MRIMIDMDDVLCEAFMLKMVNEYTNKNYTFNDANGYYIQNLIKEKEQNMFFKWMFERDVYKDLRPIDDSVKYIKLLSEKHEICICSAYIVPGYEDDSVKLIPYKYKWLKKYFSFLNMKNYIFACNKEFIDCDIYIDDSPNNLKKKDKINILYTAYHNKALTKNYLSENNLIRKDNWLEIAEFIENLK